MRSLTTSETSGALIARHHLRNLLQMECIGRNGVVMGEIEKTDKSSWLDQFSSQRPDLFFPEDWSEDEKQYALDELKPARMKSAMFASIPLNCKASKCPFAKICPLQQKGQAPKGKPCPYEQAQVQAMTMQLINELAVDPDNLIEVSMVRTLVDQEIQYMRASNMLSMEDMIQDAVIGVSDRGEPIMKKELHLAVDLQDRILKRKDSLRKQFVATREAKAKHAAGELDTALQLSDIFVKVRDIQNAQEKMLKSKLADLPEIIEGDIIED